MLFKLRKVESPLCSFCKAEDETYIRLFYRCAKTSTLWRQLQELLSTVLDLASISPQSAIFGFLDDAIDHKFLFVYLFAFILIHFFYLLVFFMLLLLFCTVKRAISETLHFPFQRHYSCFRMRIKSKSF